MNYKELLNQHDKEMNEFSEKYIYWIFGTNESDIIHQMDELGLSLDDLISIGNSGYIEKENYDSFVQLQKRIKKEHKQYMLNNVYEVVYYQCWNLEMELSLSYTYNDLIYKVLDFSYAESKKHGLEIEKALSDYRREFYEEDCS